MNKHKILAELETEYEKLNHLRLEIEARIENLRRDIRDDQLAIYGLKYRDKLRVTEEFLGLEHIARYNGRHYKLGQTIVITHVSDDDCYVYTIERMSDGQVRDTGGIGLIPLAIVLDMRKAYLIAVAEIESRIASKEGTQRS